MKKYLSYKELIDEAYNCAYRLSNDWVKDSPTWKDVEKAFVEGYKLASGKNY